MNNVSQENIDNILNYAKNTHLYKSYIVARLDNDGEVTRLYEYIPDFSYAVVLAQYAMDKHRGNGVIIIFPGYNDSKFKNMEDFEKFAENLAEEYQAESHI